MQHQTQHKTNGTILYKASVQMSKHLKQGKILKGVQRKTFRQTKDSTVLITIQLLVRWANTVR